MEYGSIRTKEIISFIVSTNVEHLTLGFDVSVITRELLLIASERGLWYFRVNWIIYTWFTRYRRVVSIFVRAIVFLT